MRQIITAIVLFISLISISSCSSEKGREGGANKEEQLRQVLRVQSLYNIHPGEDIVPEMMATIDSMRSTGRTPYYYAALNVLIDRLFSEGHFAEADSLAVKMQEEADSDSDSLSIAMAKRVRAQMFYKLSQPEKALQELDAAPDYVSDPYRSGSDFGTATSIQEWLWIISRELGDTTAMNEAGEKFASMVDANEKINRWTDSTFHYPVSALSFRAQAAFSKGDNKSAKEFLDSASSKILPALPARAYEHLYTVRCKVRAAHSDWTGAIADADTLLHTHKDFPWFYLKDLLLKAEILNMAGKHEESAKTYSEYVNFHDSLSNKITDKRLHDLTVLYRSELDHEQKRADRFRIFAFGAVILLLVILLLFAFSYSIREKRRNRLLVERLKELDRAAETAFQLEEDHISDDASIIDRLDRHMYFERPYTDPSLSRKELAEFCGISTDALGLLIKNEKGMSVRNYINSFRLEEARRILGSDSDEGIADMAVRLGFGTSRTLQRAFKERYDMSPSQYRDASHDLESPDI
ncbi:MAG: helix-turn-helix domain-containing protein [Muribaculaceae bacterium]|nr:helix-turn-helix domain-containing protein [Muribaculaceae bacterium]